MVGWLVGLPIGSCWCWKERVAQGLLRYHLLPTLRVCRAQDMSIIESEPQTFSYVPSSSSVAANAGVSQWKEHTTPRHAMTRALERRSHVITREQERERAAARNQYHIVVGYRKQSGARHCKKEASKRMQRQSVRSSPCNDQEPQRGTVPALQRRQRCQPGCGARLKIGAHRADHAAHERARRRCCSG